MFKHYYLSLNTVIVSGTSTLLPAVEISMLKKRESTSNAVLECCLNPRKSVFLIVQRTELSLSGEIGMYVKD